MVQQIRGKREGKRGIPRVKSFAAEGRQVVGLAVLQEQRPIQASLSVSRCASVPTPLDSPHSASTLTKISEQSMEGGKTEETDEILLASVKLLSIAIEPKLLFAAHLKYKRKD